MAPFLPVQGLNRSQNIRVGGQVLQYGKTTYVDLGFLPVPTFSFTAQNLVESETGETAPGQKKETAYYYVVTALDGQGGETPASAEVKSAGTLKGAETAGVYNQVTLSWLAVPGAEEYNVYRGTESGKETLLGTTKTNKFVDSFKTKSEEGKASPPTTNSTFFNSGKNAYSPRAELKMHSAIGAYITVGSLTATNSDWVVTTGGGFKVVSLSGLKPKIATGEVRQRSTGTYVKEATGADTVVTFSAASGTEDRTDAIVLNLSTGVVEGVKGTVAAIGKSVAPATPAGTLLLSTWLVAKSATVAVQLTDSRPIN